MSLLPIPSSSQIMKVSYIRMPFGLLALFAGSAVASLPYSPTRLFASPDDGSYVYVLQSTASSSAKLLALDASSTIDNTSLPYATLSASLPFLENGAEKSFTPVMDEQGQITVYAGSCTDTADGASIWRFIPSKEMKGNGTWTKQDVSTSGLDGGGQLDGANYLASGIAFAGAVNSSSDFFIFGGMCPNTSMLSSGDWTQSANYSNNMLTLTAPSSPSPSASLPSTYDLRISSSRGPPIPEAGFSITPLTPTFSNSSGGYQSRQQNFVLLGGHTQEAFINMSQVALFALPQQSWSFLPVDSPTTNANTELALRGSTNVDPRSGHTAVLTSDGKRVVVFGGWVGNVSTPANPQLAILDLGEGYGGTGDWQWNIPTQTCPGLGGGNGLYGHGAVMLPGDVMMVIGGYSISGSGNAKAKRADTTLSTQHYFYNTTSGTWLSSYSRPKNIGGSAEPNKGIMNAAKRAGLGAGLALGFAAILGVIILYFWYSRRLRIRREAREKELNNLAFDAHDLSSSALSHGGIDGRGGEKTAVEWASNRPLTPSNAYPWTSTPAGRRTGQRVNGATEAERTGLLVEIPSPTRGLRRSLHSKGNYVPAPRYDDRRRSRGSGNIHPIDERAEYEEDTIGRAPLAEPGMQHTDIDIIATAPALAPSRGLSRPPSPQSPAREREREVQKWVDDWTAADARMHQNVGHISPDKTDRTSSTLSDRSMRSTVSALSVQKSAGNISRSISQRSATFFSSTPYSAETNTANPTPAFDKSGERHPPQDYKSENRRSQSLTLLPKRPRINTSDSYTTASTSFAQLQSEGDALLGGYHAAGEGSTVEHRSRARGWMGSMRRVFTGSDRGLSPSPVSGERSASSSPTKYHHTEADLPRRAASAGAMLWRRRQGAKDWDVEDSKGGTSKAGVEEDGEWDVESAVENRVVQLMFTVPKGKLRIVNGAPDGDGASIKSLEKECKDQDGDKGKGKEQ